MKTSLGLLAFTLAQQPGLRVRCALMGGIAAPFPMEVHRWVARVSVGCPGRVAVLEFEALQAGCRLNQTIIGAADRSLLDRLTHHVHILEMNGESYRLKHSRENAASQAPEKPKDA